jgi:hypothetical protein
MKSFFIALAMCALSCRSVDIPQYKALYVKLESVNKKERYDDKLNRWVYQYTYVYSGEMEGLCMELNYPLDGDETIGSLHKVPVRR